MKKALKRSHTNTAIDVDADSDDEVEVIESDDEDEDERMLIKKTGMRSLLWEYYKIYDPNFHSFKEGQAVCNDCGDQIKTNNGTAGLKSHLQYRHPDSYDAYCKLE